MLSLNPGSRAAESHTLSTASNGRLPISDPWGAEPAPLVTTRPQVAVPTHVIRGVLTTGCPLQLEATRARVKQESFGMRRF